MAASESPVVLLMGPTASGKTQLALDIAAHISSEIISVDSALVYRGLDIGSAKPDAETRKRVPHHLLDILDPSESYSAARFCEDATRLIDEIRARGNLPLLVGGTMLYYRALLGGLNDLPSADAGFRAGLEKEAAEQGWPALHARLARLDPDSAARLHPNDSQRIQRALEIIELSGLTPTQFYAQQRAPTLKHPYLKLALNPPERSELHARIEKRFGQMMQQGFLDEVRALHRRGDLHEDLPSIRAVGYRQLWRHLEGEYPLEVAVQRGIAATRQLAKRQLTWLRKEPDLRLLDPAAPNLLQEVLSLMS